MKHILMLLLLLAGLLVQLSGAEQQDYHNGYPDEATWRKSLTDLVYACRKHGFDDLAKEGEKAASEAIYTGTRIEKSKTLTGVDKSIFMLDGHLKWATFGEFHCKYLVALAEKEDRKADVKRWKERLRELQKNKADVEKRLKELYKQKEDAEKDKEHPEQPQQ